MPRVQGRALRLSRRPEGVDLRPLLETGDQKRDIHEIGTLSSVYVGDVLEDPGKETSRRLIRGIRSLGCVFGLGRG